MVNINNISKSVVNDLTFSKEELDELKRAREMPITLDVYKRQVHARVRDDGAHDGARGHDSRSRSRHHHSIRNRSDRRHGDGGDDVHARVHDDGVHARVPLHAHSSHHHGYVPVLRAHGHDRSIRRCRNPLLYADVLIHARLLIYAYGNPPVCIVEYMINYSYEY